MNARGVRHVLVDHLGQAPGGLGRVHVEPLAHVDLERAAGGVGMQPDRAPGEALRIEPAEHEIGVRHRGTLSAPPVAGRPRLGARALGTDPDLPHRVHLRERSAAGADLDHVDDRNRDRHARALLEAVGPGHLEHPRRLRRVVADQADLGRGPAHVEGQHPIETVARGDVRGEHRPAGRPRLHQPHGKLRRALERDDAAARVHQEDRAIGTLPRQPLAKPRQVALHQGLDVGVGDGRVEALVLAHLRRDLGGERDHHLRQRLVQHLADHPLVRAVDVGVQEAHRDALVARLAELLGQCPDLRPVEGHEDSARRVDAFVHDVAAVAREQRLRQDEVQVVLLEAALGAHLDHVAKALRRDQRRLRPAPLDQRVGGERGAVDDLPDRRGRGPRRRADPVHALDDRLLGRPVRGQHLRRGAPVRTLEHHVGEGAADVDAESGGGGGHGVSRKPSVGTA